MCIFSQVNQCIFYAYRAKCIFLNCVDPKPTLKEELAAEKEEAWREKKYEDYVARRSKMSSGNKRYTFS